MAIKNWSQEVAAGSMPLDLTVDPNLAGNTRVPAEWIEIPGGGTLTYLAGDGTQQTLTTVGVEYVNHLTIRKLVSLTGSAAPNLVRVGTGPGPSAQNVSPGPQTFPPTAVLTADPAPAVIDTLVLVDPTSAGFAVTLPAISAANHGHRIGIKNNASSTNNITVTPTGTDKVESGSTDVVSGAKFFRTYEANFNVSPANWIRVV